MGDQAQPKASDHHVAQLQEPLSAEQVSQIIDVVSQVLDSGKFIVSVAIGPAPISPEMLRPAGASNLPFAIAPPSYLRFGALKFN